MLIVLALSGMLLFIITKLHKGDVEDQQDMSAWRSLHGDVFRAPPHVPLLAVLLGTGAQILCTACVTLFLGLTGSLSFSKKYGFFCQFFCSIVEHPRNRWFTKVFVKIMYSKVCDSRLLLTLLKVT